MSNFVQCGLYYDNGELSQVVCDTETGDVVSYNDLNGAYLFSNMSVQNPLPNATPEAYSRIIKDYNIDGVILSGTYIIFLKGGQASYYKYREMESPVHLIKFDTDTEYEVTSELYAALV